MLMDRYPVIIYIGAAILGKVGAEMVVSDAVIAGYINLPALARYGFEAFCAAGVIVAGRICLRRLIDKEKQGSS